jgi:hypothetical protein
VLGYGLTVTSLSLECRIEGGRPEVVRDIDADRLEAAIRRLDGARYNDLGLWRVQEDGAGPDSLSVSGDRAGRYLVGYDERGGEMIWYAAEPGRGDEPEENVVGGQEDRAPGPLVGDPGDRTQGSRLLLRASDAGPRSRLGARPRLLARVLSWV